ncbi:hypothetical protein Goklo_023496 [Gossypium klotzschianum]|uniref:Uncharacterized protein n=1 Tax=Gossypium klotzschianum TaxID=34286 RepID=A0A7J8TQT7_9ROSI|nr:hypothetical protein [Gossypium klotzschianum]
MNPEEGSNDNKREVDASLDEMDVSATQSQQFNPNKVDSTFPKKKKSFEASEPNSSTSLIDAATLLGDNIRTVDQIDALIKICDHPTQMLIFLTLPPSMRLA